MNDTVFRQMPSDLGLEPPISTEGATVPNLLRGRVNARWLVGIILIGVTGAGLMVFSVAGALGPLRRAVKPPQMTKLSRDDRSGLGAQVVMRKGDKLIRRVNLVAARQDYRAPVLVRAGDAEVTRQNSFTRLYSPLALETLGFADAVPAFNLAKLVSLASEDRAALDSEQGIATDSEVGLSLKDIRAGSVLPAAKISLSEDLSYGQVRDMLSERKRDPAPKGGQTMLAKAMSAQTANPSSLLSFSNGVGDPFSKLVVRMVPENVSVFARQEAVLDPLPVEEKLLVAKNESNATQALRGAGATPDQARQIVAALTNKGKAPNLDGNRILKLTLQPVEPGQPKVVMRAEVFADEQLVASTGRRDDGSFWPIELREVSPKAVVKTAGAPKAAEDTKETAEDDTEDEDTSDPRRLTLYASIHETARRHDIAPAAIDEAIRTVFFDVDLQKRAAPGDSLEMLVANGEGEQAKPELLLVSLVTGGVKRRYYRFKLPEDDVVDYFDPEGRSVKQFLIRKPIDGGDLRSTFGMRRHPILGYYRMHNGVDWAAPVGTPIRAAGSGNVRFAGWDSGYGRRVEIEHNHGYVTTYNHMSAFGPGIATGTRVRQGQIIGRLGSTGLSTGPHLHYEVMINERMVDPLGIKLPKGRELAGRPLANFKRERDQIDQVLRAAPGASNAVAQN